MSNLRGVPDETGKRAHRLARTTPDMDKRRRVAMTKPKKAKLPDVWVVWFGPRPEAYTDRADAKLAAFNKIEPKRYALYQKPKTCRWEIRSGKHLGRVWRTACLTREGRVTFEQPRTFCPFCAGKILR